MKSISASSLLIENRDMKLAKPGHAGRLAFVPGYLFAANPVWNWRLKLASTVGESTCLSLILNGLLE